MQSLAYNLSNKFEIISMDEYTILQTISKLFIVQTNEIFVLIFFLKINIIFSYFKNCYVRIYLQ